MIIPRNSYDSKHVLINTPSIACRLQIISWFIFDVLLSSIKSTVMYKFVGTNYKNVSMYLTSSFLIFTCLNWKVILSSCSYTYKNLLYFSKKYMQVYNIYAHVVIFLIVFLSESDPVFYVFTAKSI